MDEDKGSGVAVIGVAITIFLFLFLLWLFWLNGGAYKVSQHIATSAPAASAASSSPAPTNSLEGLGQAGDAFGSLNALFAAFAGSAAVAVAFLQAQQLRDARKGMEEARQAFEEERRSRLKQEFESTFFKMLELSRELMQRIQSLEVYDIRGIVRTKIGGDRTLLLGAPALDRLAHFVLENTFSAVDAEAADTDPILYLLVRTFKEEVYNKQPESLGPYFRSLFQLYKLVDQSSLSEDDKIIYANIVRGQLSEGAVLLLALNALTPVGHPFVFYIEKYGLLEHMHPQHLRFYERALRVAYRERAFLGSKERKAYPFIPTPIHPADHYLPTEREGRQS